MLVSQIVYWYFPDDPLVDPSERMQDVQIDVKFIYSELTYYMLIIYMLYLNHSSQQNIDFVFAVTEITTFNKVVILLTPSPGWCVQFEGPQEVWCIFEVWSNGENFMDQVLYTLNVSTSLQFTFNWEVIGDWNTLSLMLLGENSMMNWKYVISLSRFHCCAQHIHFL